VVIFLALLFSYLTVEVAYRLDPSILNRLPHPKFYSDLAGSLKPNVRAVARWHPDLPFLYTTDGQGLRKSVPPAEQANRRILCIGDSYTFGFGVTDAKTFPSQLQMLLNSWPGPNSFQVVNAGVMGIGIVENLHYFQTKANRMPADLMVLQFNIYDIELLRSDVEVQNYRKGKPFAPLEDQLLAEDVNVALVQALLANPVFTFLTSQPPLQPNPTTSATSTPEQDRLRLAKRVAGNKDKLLDERYLAFTAPLWQRYLESMEMLHQAATSAGMDFLLVIVPDPEQLHDYKNGPSVAILEYCRARGIKTLDMTEAFRRLYLDQGINPFLEPLDTHCSAAGNAVIAQRIAGRIDRDVAGRPVFLPADEAVRYRDPVTISLSFDDDGRFVLPENWLVATSEQDQHNMILELAAGRSVKYLTTSKKDGEGRARLQLRLRQPVEAAALVFFPRANTGEPGSRCDVALRFPLQTASFSTAKAPVPTGWNSFEQEAFLRVTSDSPSIVELDIEVTTRGDGGLGLQDIHIGQPRRRLDLILYPAILP
jgi:lysophospholipase L1-like esterase